MKESCVCFSERTSVIKLSDVVLPHPVYLFFLPFFSFPFPLLPSFPTSSNRDTSKGEQVSQNGLPAEQGSPRVSYRSQTYQNYKNFNSRRTASDQPWSGLWSSLPFVKNHSFQVLLVWLLASTSPTVLKFSLIHRFPWFHICLHLIHVYLSLLTDECSVALKQHT